MIINLIYIKLNIYIFKPLQKFCLKEYKEIFERFLNF